MKLKNTMGINSRRLEPAKNSWRYNLDVEYLKIWIKGLTLVLFLIVFSFYFIPVSNLLLVV
jgi:hypothetical protein